MVGEMGCTCLLENVVAVLLLLAVLLHPPLPAVERVGRLQPLQESFVFDVDDSFFSLSEVVS